jgi:hypothetical protein
MSDCAIEPFAFDWSEFYTRHGLDPATSPITSSVWTVTNATKSNETTATPVTQVTLTPTVGPGNVVTAENRISIGSAYRDCRKLSIEVF